MNHQDDGPPAAAPTSPNQFQYWRPASEYLSHSGSVEKKESWLVVEMSVLKWIYQYLVAVAVVFCTLFVIALVRGRSFEQSLLDSSVWAVITAGIFIGARYYRRSRGEYCTMCGDEPPVNATAQNGQCNIERNNKSAAEHQTDN